MKNAIIAAVIAAAALAGCNTLNPAVNRQSIFVHEGGQAGWPVEKSASHCNIPREQPGDYRASTGAGDRKETAILFQGELTERTGIAAEYAYVARQLPGWHVCGQSLLTPEARLYDILQLENDAGASRSVYFDITDWFGKF
jgi:hypothetical protein